MKSVLVTGASGFIGRCITRALVEKGYSVRAQYRRSAPPAELLEASRKGAELVRADLCVPGAAAELVRGVDNVIHAAAFLAMTGSRNRFYEVNVDATESLMVAAAEAGCRKFVFLSSIAIHGFGHHLDSEETGPYYRLISHYQRSKKAAENLVSGYDPSVVPWTILRPGLVYGPGDTTTLKPVFDLLLAGSLPLLGGFGVYNCPVFVDDLVQGIIRALESDDAVGEIFNIVSGEKILLSDAVAYAAELLDRPVPRLNIPVWAARAAGLALELLYKLPFFHGEPLITNYLVAELTQDFHFSPAKAKELLGYEPRTVFTDGLRLAVEAYLQNLSLTSPE